MTTIERPHGAGTLVIRPSGPHHQGTLARPHPPPYQSKPTTASDLHGSASHPSSSSSSSSSSNPSKWSAMRLGLAPPPSGDALLAWIVTNKYYPQIAFGIHRPSSSSSSSISRISRTTGRWPPSRALLPSRDPPAGPSPASSICQCPRDPPSRRSPQRNRLSTTGHRHRRRPSHRPHPPRRHQRRWFGRPRRIPRSRIAPPGRRYVNTSLVRLLGPGSCSGSWVLGSGFWVMHWCRKRNKRATRSFTPRLRLGLGLQPQLHNGRPQPWGTFYCLHNAEPEPKVDVRFACRSQGCVWNLGLFQEWVP